MTPRARRIAQLYLPEFRVERWRARRPELAGSVFAVWERRGPRELVVAASREARARGLRQEMNLSEARALCRGLTALEVAPEDELRALEALAEVMGAYSPLVVLDGPHGLQLDVSSPARRFGGEGGLARCLITEAADQGYLARVAVAGGAEIARLVAMFSPDDSPADRPDDRYDQDSDSVRLVQPGRDAEALAGIPLEQLGLPPELARALSLLGLHRLGEVARLPRGTVPRRFGAAGLRLQRLAQGIDESRPEAYVPRGLIRERQDFEPPLSSLEPLLFCCKQLLDRVEQRLRARAAATTRLLLRLHLEGPAPGVTGSQARADNEPGRILIEVPMAKPFRSAISLLRICRARLGVEQTRRCLQAPIVSLELSVLEESPYKEASADLFRRRAAQEEGTAELVARLIAALGEAAVFAVRPRAVWRPEDAFERVPYRADKPAKATRAKVRKGSGISSRSGRVGVGRSGGGGSAGFAGDAAAISAERNRNNVPTWECPVDDSVGGFPGNESSPTNTGAGTSLCEALKASRTASPANPPEPPPPDSPHSPGHEAPKTTGPRYLDRPLRLFDRPEPASWAEGAVHWRGGTHQIDGLLGPERLEADWWSAEPLNRDYYVLDLASGDRLWLFEDPKGRVYVQGCFD